MDNFRNKHKAGASRFRTVDGIISYRPVQGSKPSDSSKPRHPQTLNTDSPLGNFRQTEGFHAYKQGNIGTPVTPGQLAGKVSNRPGMTIDLPEEGKHAKKAKKKRGRWSNWSWRKRLMVSSSGILILLVAVVGFLFAKGYIKLHNVLRGGGGAAALQKNVDPNRLRGEGDGRVNILMLGRGGDGHAGPDLTDTILVASIDPVQKEAALLSIPRDLYVKNSYGGHVKINEIYADAKYAVLNGRKIPNQKQAAEDAGFKAIESTVSATMGIPIHYHVLVDFKAFRDAVNTVGGVDLNVTTSLYEVQWLEDIHRNYVLNVPVGHQHFDGVRALAYARSRHTSPRGDFDRTERQRALLVALKEKVFSLGTYSNPVKISQLLDAFGNHVETNLSTKDVQRLYEIGKEFNSSKVQSVGLADPPNNYVKTAFMNGLSVVIPTAGLDDYSKIQSYVRNTLKDSFIKNENANITVLNGTNVPGLATQKANELKSYGYNVGTVGDAPTKNYKKTILVDLTKGVKKYTKHYLELRFGVTAVTKLPTSAISPGSADFVIILGQ
ncbi:MAG TPA: LCP family protein [Candidatus Saccharimonadales bacterium]|nr:LCP family protein [Candidatus Saccharimonadales bacterium]